MMVCWRVRVSGCGGVGEAAWVEAVGEQAVLVRAKRTEQRQRQRQRKTGNANARTRRAHARPSLNTMLYYSSRVEATKQQAQWVCSASGLRCRAHHRPSHQTATPRPRAANPTPHPTHATPALPHPVIYSTAHSTTRLAITMPQ